MPRDILERLTPGDLVVHIDHGVARYEQMLRRGGAGEERDYLELSFAGGDRIFVPVEQIGRVSALLGRRAAGALASSAGPTGCGPSSASARRSTTWPRSSSRCTPSRAGARGHAFAPDTPWQAEMEARFPYEETVDQLRAVAEVKADMEPVRPMDRLVVGDVGYGKTEVALRAAFKAIQDGKQVAVLVPDDGPRRPAPRDVLAALRGLPARGPAAVAVRAGQASRRRRSPASPTARSTSSSGPTGCCRKDVRFRDLGLVVVDEEQRFGVAAKERLKQLRREVDVLTLSATPIPRTLNLALAGIRDL